MSKKTIADEITTIAQYEINRTPKPIRCKITKVYADDHVDIETNNGPVEYVEAIGNNLTIGNLGVLIFLDGDENDYIVITK